MKRSGKVTTIWLVTAGLAALMIGVLARPMVVAWRCYDLHASGEQASARVVGKEPGIGLALSVTSGSQAGQACLVKASEANLDAFEIDDPVQVVLPQGRPGDCVLLATIEASGALLTSVSAVTVALLLGLLLGALVIQRSVTQSATLTTRMDLGSDSPPCPRCGKEMSEGYLPLLAGLHWRKRGEPTGLPHALGGLPGTVGWRGRPRLH
ncbi:MAG: hypothetical protein ACR2P8_12200, partial [Myxococcota bacterium]